MILASTPSGRASSLPAAETFRLPAAGFASVREDDAGKDLNAARADVFDDIERFCNPRRRHSTLGNLSSVAFEERQRFA